MIRNLLALLGLAAIGIVAAMALQASRYARGWDDDGDVQRMRVSYAGLDLASPEGVRLLERRIDLAIRRVCPDEGYASLDRSAAITDCRRRAIAMVDPQVERAIAAARARAGYDEPRYRDDRYPDQGYDDDRYGGDGYADDRYAPPPPPAPRWHPRPVDPDYQAEPIFAPPVEVVQPLPPEDAFAPEPQAVRRRITPPTRSADARPVARHAPARAARYGRTATVAGSWLPPSAWRAIERATKSAFAHGRLVRWAVPGREGYVTVSAARWIKGCACRSVRVVKYAPQGQIVVAEGTRCRLPGGGLTG